MKDIKVEDALKIEDPIFIDVRAPKEFKEASIPGAVNIPVFNNEERAEVGKTYHNQGTEEARILGLEYVSPKLPDMVTQIRELSELGTPIIYCWRGGERSKSICNVMKIMRVKGYRIEGGYKAYRRYILEQLEEYQFNPEVIVLHGYTGTGKTDILHQLAKRNHPVLDLEGLAGHRGSAFGSIGIEEVRNQKQFDALLYNRLEELKDEPYVLIEAESKRIGRVHLPDFMVQKKMEGLPILVESSVESRARQIVGEYVQEEGQQEFVDHCLGSLNAIKKRLVKKIGKEDFAKLEEAIKNSDFEIVAASLLSNYYDPLYKHSQKKYDYQLKVDANKLKDAVQEIDQFLKIRYPGYKGQV